MGIMSFLRDRMGVILVIIIGFALFAFIAGEVITYGRSFMSGDRNTVGEVAGTTLNNDDYQKSVNENVKNMQQQYNQASITPQLTSFAQQTAWNQFVTKAVLTREMDKLGLTVGENEINSMITGPNPDPQIVQAFGDPKTGQIDQSRYNQFLNNVHSAKKGDPILDQWAAFITPKIESRKIQKYLSLVHNGLFVNDLDVKDDYEAKNKLANFKYITLDYASLPDDKVSVTDADYQDYYDAHKAQFKNAEQTRTFEYVSFNGSATKADSAAVKAQMEDLTAKFKADNNDSLFVQINSEDKSPLVYQKKGQLEPKLDSVMFNAPKGFVYGPYVSNGSYKIAKLVDERTGPDSVKARHILISPNTAGSMEKAKSRIDSLEKLIQGGKSFADLAKTYSEDKGSAEKGGELGIFGRGAMVPAFEDAAFNGQKGEYKVVTSPYGVHLIQIEDQKGSSKVVKVAVVTKPITPSNATQSDTYAKAQAFISSVNSDNFAQVAKKDGYAVKTADDVNGNATSLPGLDNARELIRWAFNDASKGDVSDKVYPVGDQYIVAKLTAIKPQGQLSLDDVKAQIKPQVLKEVKAKQLITKLQSAVDGSSNINQAAQKAGVKVNPVQNLVLANPVIPGSDVEYKLVGTIFGSPVNKLSKPVQGEHGVYAFSVDGFVNPAPLTNAANIRNQMEQVLAQRADNQAYDALKDKANVKDYRAKFL